MSEEPGFIVKAPEHFLSTSDLQSLRAKDGNGRRDFLARAFAAAAAVGTTRAGGT